MNDNLVVNAENLTKTYQMGEVKVQALRGASLQVQSGELLSIMGPSGSGKSTLMNILGCLDQPTSGKYYLEGIDVAQLADNKLSQIRGKRIGFVFQSFNLLPRTSALANVELPLVYMGVGRGERRRRSIAALEMVGLGGRVHHKPNELSGGQQQRVAIARALVTDPAIIMADEPTGNLDSKSSVEIMGIFQHLNEERGITVIFVTHEPDIAEHTRRVIRLADGQIVEDRSIAHPRRVGVTEATPVGSSAAHPSLVTQGAA
ncbi:MAG TPA: ABC transporter ATP-binding protein [Anaerolineae bacterium]|nr:ABC transporter ATP-binding protein [Anaerolineae bacterium]MCB9107373.1 ABC transporter ATP-binding protein [Anaerolineales bacterium]HRV95584.1 ABC transporter ATP-binding protein [Anaerolineae bacterium]